MIVRRILDLPADKNKEIQELIDELGLEDFKALFNVSVTILQYLIDQIKSGRVIGTVNETDNSYKEMALDKLIPKLKQLQGKEAEQWEWPDEISAIQFISDEDVNNID